MAGVGRMDGKTCVVTGASSGIGRVTALELARAGGRVVMVCRDRARGDETRRAIAVATGAEVALVIADLSSQRATRGAASELLAQCPKIDLLVNNAGAIIGQREITVDGLERTLATNHLGYFLLTTLLLDRLRASAPARIVNVASEAHRRGHLDFDDLQAERGYAQLAVYSNSKLANVLFTYELARRLAGSGVTANCLHPGVIASGFGDSASTFARLLVKVGRPFLLSPEQGAATQLYLATSPDVEGITGQYYDKCRPKQSNRESYDLAVQRRLWDESLRLTQRSS